MQRLLIKMQNVRAFGAMEVVAVVGAAASLVASAAAAVHLVVSTATARKKI